MAHAHAHSHWLLPGVLRGTYAPFEPLTDSQCDVLWLSHLGLTLTGSDVDDWEAQIQVTDEHMEDAAGNKPTVDAVNQLNGYNTIAFDGTACMTFRETGTNAWNKPTGSHYWMLIAKFDTPAGADEYVIDFPTGRYTQFVRLSSTNTYQLNYNTGVKNSGDAVLTDWAVWEIELDATAQTAKMWLNGTEIYSDSGYTTAISMNGSGGFFRVHNLVSNQPVGNVAAVGYRSGLRPDGEYDGFAQFYGI